MLQRYNEVRRLTPYDVLEAQASVQKLKSRRKSKRGNLDSEWSDEEGDYKPKHPPLPRTELAPDESAQPPVSNIGWKPQRIKKPYYHSGEAVVVQLVDKVQLPSEKEIREKREKELEADLPLPRVAPHVKETLGEDFLKVLSFIINNFFCIFYLSCILVSHICI
jgi:hypothetical protein